MKKAEKARGELWNTNVEDLLSFQRNLLLRVSDYVRDVGNQASSGAIDPGALINSYANFWSSVIEDLGEWSLGSRSEARPSDPRIPVVRKSIPKDERTASIPFVVPREAFVDAEGTPVDDVTVSTDGLLGRIALRPEDNVRIYPNTPIPFLNPRASLRVFKLNGLVNPGDVYRGTISVDGTRTPIVAVELRVV